MVVGGEQHFVAGLEVDAGGHEVVRLAGVAGDDDLLRRDAQELGEQLARVLAAVAQLGAVVLRRILIHVLRHPVHRLEHRAGRGTQVGGVQHRQLFRHDELIADADPEFFVGRRGRRRQLGGAWPGQLRRHERAAPPMARSRANSRRFMNPSAEILRPVRRSPAASMRRPRPAFAPAYRAARSRHPMAPIHQHTEQRYRRSAVPQSGRRCRHSQLA